MTNDGERNVEAAIALSNQVHNRVAVVYELLINNRHPYTDAFYDDVAQPLQSGACCRGL